MLSLQHCCTASSRFDQRRFPLLFACLSYVLDMFYPCHLAVLPSCFCGATFVCCDLATAVLEEGGGDNQVPPGGLVLPKPAGQEERGHEDRAVVPSVERPDPLCVHEEGREGRQGNHYYQLSMLCIALRVCSCPFCSRGGGLIELLLRQCRSIHAAVFGGVGVRRTYDISASGGFSLCACRESEQRGSTVVVDHARWVTMITITRRVCPPPASRCSANNIEIDALSLV